MAPIVTNVIWDSFVSLGDPVMFPCLQFTDWGPRNDVCIPNAANLYCGTRVHFLTVLFCQCMFSLRMSTSYSNCCWSVFSTVYVVAALPIYGNILLLNYFEIWIDRILIYEINRLTHFCCLCNLGEGWFSGSVETLHVWSMEALAYFWKWYLICLLPESVMPLGYQASQGTRI